MKSMVIISSVMKLDTGIFSLHLLHLPFRKMKLNIGISSYHISGFLQLSQQLLLYKNEMSRADVSAYTNDAHTPPSTINKAISSPPQAAKNIILSRQIVVKSQQFNFCHVFDAEM